ncbi:MAG: SH3 domain-containing protein [Anaerolineae bacterium]
MKARRVWLRILAPVVLLVLVAVVPVLSVSAAPPVPPTTAAPPVFGAATTVRAYGGLRLREGPSLSDPIILVMPNGATVYPAGEPIWNEGVSWTYVRYYGAVYYYEGFAATAYLGTGGGTVPPPPTGSGLKVTADLGLRLRAGPGLGYAIQRVVPYGTILQPTGATQWADGYQWNEVNYSGITVWAASMYLQAV